MALASKTGMSSRKNLHRNDQIKYKSKATHPKPFIQRLLGLSLVISQMCLRVGVNVTSGSTRMSFKFYNVGHWSRQRDHAEPVIGIIHSPKPRTSWQ